MWGLIIVSVKLIRFIHEKILVARNLAFLSHEDKEFSEDSCMWFIAVICQTCKSIHITIEFTEVDCG